jgi:polar amino acid transport system substrate-binding protein
MSQQAFRLSRTMLCALLASAAGAGLAAFPARAAQESIDVYYNERPPYLVSERDGSVSGLTGTPATQAFRAAGISFVWIRMPSNRQMKELQENRSPACAVGWFKSAERERFAKFSKPIYQDRPTVGLANADSPIPEHEPLSALLANKKRRILVKDGYSYGPYIDRLLHSAKAGLMATTMENIEMTRMIALHRADMMFAAEEEASALLQQAGLNPLDFHILRFPDVPKGERRYILCSQSVPDQLMQRLNAAIPPLTP